MNDCGKTSRKCQCSPHLRLRDKNSTKIERLMPFHWNQVTRSCLKLTPTKGRERWRTGGRRNPMKQNTKLLKVSIPTSWKTIRQYAHESSTKTDIFSSPPKLGPPLYSCTDWVGKVCHYDPGGANSARKGDWGSTTNCELSAAGLAPDRQDSSRLGKQEGLHIPSDVFRSLLDRPRVKSSM